MARSWVLVSVDLSSDGRRRGGGGRRGGRGGGGMVERETERSYFIVRLPIKVVEAFSECLWNLVVVHDYNLRCDEG